VSEGGTGLDTLARETVPRVTHLGAPVTTTGQRPPALLTAGDSLHQAGDVPPLLPATVADLVGEVSAGRAVSVTVAGVVYRVTAGMFSPARLGAVRWPGPAGDGRVDDGRPAVASQLVEADVVTGVTVAGVTVLLTVVELAGEELVAEERTRVLHSDAAQLATLVSPAASLLLTLPLTPSIVRPAGHLGAGDLLVHVAAPAPDAGGEGAGGAGAQVTPGLAGVRGGGRSAGERLATDCSTDRDLVSTAGPGLLPQQGGPAAGAGGDPVRREGAGGALARVADGLALVNTTVQGPATDLATGELDSTVSTTEPLLTSLPTVTLRGDSLLALLARPHMTLGGTPVPATGEELDALLATEEVRVAPGDPGEGPAGAGLAEGGSAGIARSRVTEVETGVRTLRGGGQGTTTHLTAGVGHQTFVPVPFWVEELPAEAPVLLRQGLHHDLAARAPPAGLHGGRPGPLPHTAEMEDLVAVAAVPGGVMLFDPV